MQGINLMAALLQQLVKVIEHVAVRLNIHFPLVTIGEYLVQSQHVLPVEHHRLAMNAERLPFPFHLLVQGHLEMVTRVGFRSLLERLPHLPHGRRVNAPAVQQFGHGQELQAGVSTPR